jgi:chromosome segregation ATPase
METMVALEQFSELKEKYERTKAILKDAKAAIIEKENELGALGQKVQQLEYETQLQHSRLALSGKTCKDLQDKLLGAHDDVNMLRLELQSRNREVLSLERRMAKQKSEKKLLASQVSGQIAGERAAPDYQHVSHEELGVRLANMSRALGQT